MPQLWEVRKGVGVHQSQLKNQAADVLTSATTNPRSNIQLLALNGAKLFVFIYLFIYFGTSGNIRCKKTSFETF
jgi:hypothetical protein